MDNHLHVLHAADPDVANGWSDEEVVRHGDCSLPAGPVPATPASFQSLGRVASQRPRLGRDGLRLHSLSWFMKCLKEPVARLADRRPHTLGVLRRTPSVAILDDESLLATCTYIDLNPVAAGIVVVRKRPPDVDSNRRT